MVVDTPNAGPPRKKRRPPLDTLARIRSELAYQYRRAENGEVPLSDATKLGYLLMCLARMVADETFEKRIEALEALPAIEHQPSPGGYQ
jgi:hypothetical protein